MVLEWMIPSPKVALAFVIGVGVTIPFAAKYNHSVQQCTIAGYEAKMAGKPLPVCDIQTVPRQLEEIANGARDIVVSEFRVVLYGPPPEKLCRTPS